MMPPLAVMAVMTMGYGVCMLLNDLRETPFLPYPWPLVILAAVLGSLVWYAIRNSRAKPRLFRYVTNMARSRYGSGPRVKFYP